MDRVAAFLVTARTCQSLLSESAVAAGWTQPSALPGFTVRRHGATAVMRALARFERAPLSIAAF